MGDEYDFSGGGSYLSSDLANVMNQGDVQITGNTPDIGSNATGNNSDSSNNSDSGWWDVSSSQHIIDLGNSNYFTDGTSRNADYSVPEKSLAESLFDRFKNLFSPSTDAQGRAQESFAAKIIAGAANGLMMSMAQDKGIAAQKSLEDQRSSNKIKEAEAALNLTRNAASAMPAPTYNTGRRTVGTGLLGGANAR